MIKVDNLSYMYNGCDYYAIKDISFSLNKGQHLSIIGPNGCGKTTLLKCIAKILYPQGSVEILGKNISDMNRKELARKMAYMTQMNNIYFDYNVYETVAQGRYAYTNSIFSKFSKEDDIEIEKALEMVGMENFKKSSIMELSGGQLQRVFLARIFAQNPNIILLDEPTNHLDLKNQIELLEHLREWVEQENRCVISVLHDLNLVQMYSDKVLLMQYGKIYSQGDKNQVLSKENINKVYSYDISNWMKEALAKWTD